MKYFVIFALFGIIGFTSFAHAIPEFTDSEKVYAADVIAIGQILSYYDEGKYRFYEISILRELKNTLPDNPITMRSINESGFDPIDPYNVFENSDLVLLYLKDYDRGFWESTNFSSVIFDGQMQNIINKITSLVEQKENLIPEPEPPYFKNIDKEKPCDLETIYQDGICVIDKIENSTEISADPSKRWGGPYTFDGKSPLKQFKSGVPFDKIKCGDDSVLIQKYDSSPACVKPITVDKLYERGWADPLTTYFCFSEYLPVCGIDDVTYGNLCFMEKSGVELKHDGECDNVTFFEYQLDETEFLQIKNNMENVGYHICDIQLEENKILIVLNWIFEDSEPEKMLLSQIPSNVNYEIKYLDEYSDYFISKESVFACKGLENEK